MFEHRASNVLPPLRDCLQEWAAEVPLRAERFHEVRRTAAKQIEDRLRRLWPFVSDDELERLKGPVEGLGKIVRELLLLLAEADRLGQEARQLAGGLDGLDPEVEECLRQRCRRWSLALERLGVDAEREADLHYERSRLETLQASLRHQGEAVCWLKEAVRVLDVLGSDVHTALLSSELPELRQRLLAAEADEDWVRALRERMQPLKEIADRLKDPPRELQTVSSLLTDLRGWSRQLGGMGERELRQLEQRHRFVALEWKELEPEELQNLLAVAEELSGRLRAEAQRVRGDKLRSLEERRHDLFQACGRQPGLEERLRALEASSSDRHQLFRDWLRQYQEVDEFFRATASTHGTALRSRLIDLVSKLEGALAELRQVPLADDVEAHADGVEQEVGELRRLLEAGAPDAEELLRGLRRAAELRAAIDGLASEGRRGTQELMERRRRLADRLRSLERAAAGSGWAVPEMGAQIERLADGSESLQQADQRARDMAVKLEGAERDFVARCRQRSAEHLTAVRRRVRLLKRVGRTAARPRKVPLPDDATPAQAAAAVAAAESALATLQQQVDEATAAFDARRRQAAARLAEIAPEGLGPGEREDLEALREEVEEGSWSLLEGLERLEGLAVLSEKCDLFFAHLLKEEETARRRHQALLQRLRKLTEAQLTRFAPLLADRVTALLYGIPEQPRRWSAVGRQLDTAEGLLERLETHVRRLAAREVAEAVQVLQEQLQAGADPETTRTAKALLGELARVGEQELPPVNLRRRLNHAAEQTR